MTQPLQPHRPRITRTHTFHTIYDSNGNLTSKTDARGVKTDYVYDSLNRVTNRNYSTPNGTPGIGILANYQATPNVTYFYDGVNISSGIPNSKGKLTKVTSSVSTTEYVTFDILGRVTRSKQITDGVTYGDDTNPVTYTYNLSSALIEQTYPSGRVVKNTLDTTGDLQQVQSRRANDTFRNYANGFTYTAAGAVASMRLGNGKFESTQFNSRLQPTQIGIGGSASNTSLLKLNYDYGTTDNNGNVLSQTITVNRSNLSPLVFNQTYTYDSLNRLKSAVEMTGTTENWKQTYAFDRYGNRRFDQANTTQPDSFVNPNSTNPQIDTANNRFTTGQGWTYDLAGNVITDAEGRRFNYDSDNKQVTATNSSTATLGTYYFDGDGKRVKKVVPYGETTIFVYDAGGKTIAEYSTVVAPIETAKVQYLTNDNLGTPRINTDQLGNVVSRSDYMPYGEEIVGLGGRSSTDKYIADDVRQGFTGYENDAETDLDYAEARMYSDSLGRFTSVDPVKMTEDRLIDPQQINLYGYTRNNPINLIDPSGEEIDFERDQEGELTKNGQYSKKLYDEYVKKITALAEKDPAKYGSLLSTVNKLTKSEVKYIINVTTDPVGGGGEAEGSLTTDGQSVFVNVRNLGNNHETFSLDSRFAHELEHGRQFENGEIAFTKTDDGKWVPNSTSYDIYDELSAFKEQLKLSPQINDTTTLAYLRRNDTSDADKATYLSRIYPKRKDTPSNNDYLWGYSKGALVRPNQKHPNIFGRVYDPKK